MYSLFKTKVLTLAHVGGVEGCCNRFVCLSVGHFENTTSRRQIIQGSKVTTGFY